ncbi:MAG: metal-dependent transcriptional regulator [Armatimonadetes bacterium]|nr:metal-dependent transcriptional regulator [Armatimonadota bacterium]
MASESVQDYLKAVYSLGRGQENVPTSAIATYLDVAPASVTKMVKRLADEGYLRHVPYQGVALTEEGHRAALRVIRHHRLLELYLTEALGFPWDLVDAEAERLEHVISDEMESRIDAALGYPTTDPHGHPIPQRDGTLPEEDLVCLDSVEAGARVAIRRVSDADPELLRYLGGLGLYPGTTVNVCAHVPFGGPIHLQVDGRDIHLGREPAAHIFVCPLAAETPSH